MNTRKPSLYGEDGAGLVGNPVVFVMFDILFLGNRTRTKEHKDINEPRYSPFIDTRLQE